MSDPIDSAPLSRPVPVSPRRNNRRFAILTVLIVILVVAIGFALWSWIALSYVYASGQQTGYVRKLTYTGWLCKTWEGELVTSPTPAAPSRIFDFTIRDDSLATILQNVQDKQVTLSYSQHLRSPSSCFGETQYFLQGVTARQE